MVATILLACGIFTPVRTSGVTSRRHRFGFPLAVDADSRGTTPGSSRNQPPRRRWLRHQRRLLRNLPGSGSRMRGMGCMGWATGGDMVALGFFLIAIGTTLSLLLVTLVAFGMLWLRQRGPRAS